MTEQEVIAKLKGKIVASISEGQVEKVAKKAASFIREMIIQRILDGKDLYGNKFGGYNKSYNKQKAWQYAARKYGTYKYSSSSEDAKLRLTGRMLSKIRVQSGSVKKTKSLITMPFRIYPEPIIKEQVEGLQSTIGVARNGARYAKKAWYFMGLSKQLGEQTKLINYIVRQLSQELKGSITTKSK